MSEIAIKVINPLDYEELIKETKNEYGFNLKKDLSDTDLSKESFFNILQDLYLAMNSQPKKGKAISATSPYAVYKTRHKDETRNIGTSGAYRLLSMTDEEKAYPFHIYHKRAGKKPKKDLTENEKKAVKKMIKDACMQKEGG